MHPACEALIIGTHAGRDLKGKYLNRSIFPVPDKACYLTFITYRIYLQSIDIKPHILPISCFYVNFVLTESIYRSRSGCERSEFPDKCIGRASTPECQVTPAAQPDLQVAKGI